MQKLKMLVKDVRAHERKPDAKAKSIPDPFSGKEPIRWEVIFKAKPRHGKNFYYLGKPAKWVTLKVCHILANNAGQIGIREFDRKQTFAVSKFNVRARDYAVPPMTWDNPTLVEYYRPWLRRSPIGWALDGIQRVAFVHEGKKRWCYVPMQMLLSQTHLLERKKWLRNVLYKSV